MKFLDFIKSTWNMVIEVAVILAVALSDFTIPPHFSNRLIEDQINFINFSRFFIASILLILLLPAHFFKRKKDAWTWWIASVSSILVAVILYFNYNSYINDHTEWDDTANVRIVVGDSLLPGAKIALDSFTRHHPGVILSKKDMSQGLGGPERVWSKKQLADYTKSITIRYLMTVLFFSMFIVCVIQSIYTVSKKI